MKRNTVLVAAIAASLTATAVSAKVTINVWQPWGGNLGAGMIQTGKAYEAANPNVKINMVAVDNNLATNSKFFAAMAAGSPPDVIFVDGPQVIEWASKKVLTNLTPYTNTAKVKAGDYYAPSWRQCLYKGQLYSLPFNADGNFPLLYNKTLFREAGLSAPPTSLEELELQAKKINKVDDKGFYTRFGFNPWSFTGANGLFTLGFAFGGEFFDDAKDRMTVNDPKVVSALEWAIDYGKRMDQRKMDRFGTDFLKGKLGMFYGTSAWLLDIKKMKTPIEYGWGYIPGPESSGIRQSGWIGGWTVAVPANVKNRNESWKFVNWLCHGDGSSMIYKNTGFPPAARISPIYDKVDKEMMPWVEVLKISKHTRPVMPATQAMFTELDNAVNVTIAGKKSPADALAVANTNIQKELDRIIARISKRW